MSRYKVAYKHICYTVAIRCMHLYPSETIELLKKGIVKLKGEKIFFFSLLELDNQSATDGDKKKWACVKSHLCKLSIDMPNQVLLFLFHHPAQDEAAAVAKQTPVKMIMDA